MPMIILRLRISERLSPLMNNDRGRRWVRLSRHVTHRCRRSCVWSSVFVGSDAFRGRIHRKGKGKSQGRAFRDSAPWPRPFPPDSSPPGHQFVTARVRGCGLPVVARTSGLSCLAVPSARVPRSRQAEADRPWGAGAGAHISMPMIGRTSTAQVRACGNRAAIVTARRTLSQSTTKQPARCPSDAERNGPAGGHRPVPPDRRGVDRVGQRDVAEQFPGVGDLLGQRSNLPPRPGGGLTPGSERGGGFRRRCAVVLGRQPARAAVRAEESTPRWCPAHPSVPVMVTAEVLRVSRYQRCP